MRRQAGHLLLSSQPSVRQKNVSGVMLVLTKYYTAGPLPRFEGLSGPPLASQNTGPPQSPAGPPPIRVPPLAPERVAEYSSLFEKSGAQDGILPGSVAKQIFERARLPNEVLGRIWNL